MASSPRPEPTLADIILTPNVRHERDLQRVWDKQLLTKMKQGLRAAQKFVLTETAFNRIKAAMEAAPEQLIHNAKFALPPHDPMWIEVGDDARVGMADYNTGYLILDGTIYAWVYGIDHNTYMPQTFAVDLHTPPTRQEQQAFLAAFGMDPEDLDKAFWGDKLYEQIPQRLRGKLRASHRVRKIAGSRVTPEEFSKVKHLMDMHTRMVLATLLALNQPNHPLVYTVNNAQRRMTAKGPKNFVEHTVVTVTLGGPRKIQLRYRHRGAGPGNSPYHDVEDHWMHFRTAEGRTCTHGYGRAQDFWEPYGDGEKPRYRCTACGTRRVRRCYPNGWGDGSKGVRLHTHIVKTPEDD